MILVLAWSRPTHSPIFATPAVVPGAAPGHTKVIAAGAEGSVMGFCHAGVHQLQPSAAGHFLPQTRQQIYLAIHTLARSLNLDRTTAFNQQQMCLQGLNCGRQTLDLQSLHRRASSLSREVIARCLLDARGELSIA